jgi:hypothetical protein
MSAISVHSVLDRVNLLLELRNFFLKLVYLLLPLRQVARRGVMNKDLTLSHGESM